MNTYESDFLVIGSGLSGLFWALKASELGKVTIITKADTSEGNSLWAQGGIAAVVEKTDSFENHTRDTLVAGAGLCNEAVVKAIIEDGPARIVDLINMGVEFDTEKINNKSSDELSLHKEGGHSHRRILHIDDTTGAGIHKVVLKRVLENKNIKVIGHTFAVDLITAKQLNPNSIEEDRCIGCYALDAKTSEISAFKAKATVIAAGGAGKVYLYTSNWSGATGDGIAMAKRAGARIANLEFMQFHPTCLFHPSARNFLISEALRGEGATLRNYKGEDFMKKHHKLGSLAPRDIVARSIDAEMKSTGKDNVFLDTSNHPKEFWQEGFPAIYNKCKSLGFSLGEEQIPVVPAAHYLCGGILTDIHGQTDIKGLFAVGESAATGLHGANRLASNSLLECLVVPQKSVEFIKGNLDKYNQHEGDVPALDLSGEGKADEDELIVIAHLWDEVRRLMWNYVGIVRSDKRLTRAKHRLQNILSEFNDYYAGYNMNTDILELRNIAMLADLTVDCALERKESRGIHFSLDYPETKEELCKDTII